MSTAEAILFWVLAPLSVAGALGVVFSRKAVHAALFLAFTMLTLAAFYAAQQAPFLAFAQVIVYTGAVMMLFLFVVMLVGVDASDSFAETLRAHRVATTLAAVGFVVVVGAAVAGALGGTQVVGLDAVNGDDNVLALAGLIFRPYVVAFEVTGALLITAALGAMVLAHRDRPGGKASQRERALARFRGPHPTPLPGPGVYARHNAVDMPALLPDGTPARESVPTAIRPDAYEAPPPALVYDPEEETR